MDKKENKVLSILANLDIALASVILAVLIVIAAVLYGISSIISTRIYEKREF